MSIYEELWNHAVPAFENGTPRLDPFLSDKPNDLRRGVTLVLRPTQEVRDGVADYIGHLTALCPGQYFYRPEELHVTVLSIISGSPRWEEEMPRLEKCRPVITAVLADQRPFNIRFRGVTASPDSVMIQGFPAGDGLSAVRDALREGFSRAGLGDMPDRRYKAMAAHMTVMRFCRPCSESKQLLRFLKESRETHFGECEIEKIELIIGDWYASADRVKKMAEYRLPGNLGGGE